MYAPVYFDIGNVFLNQGKLGEAIQCYQKAVELKPDFVEAHYNMGNAFFRQGEFAWAVSCYQKVTDLRPDLAAAYDSMGNAFQAQGKPDEAISCFQKVIELKPNNAEAYENLISQMQLICAWQELEGLMEKLDDLTSKSLDNGRRAPDHPFANLTRHADLSRNLAIAKSWSSDIARRMLNLKANFSFDERRSRETDMTVGYLSSDFSNHPVAHLMLGLFGLHDRDRFKVFCYSYGRDDGSYYRARIRRDCDKFIDLRNLSHAEAAKCIYEDQVDILVDLKGYTAGNRLEICALRPAPIQVSWLGFPGTTGADFLDYIVTDRIVTPGDYIPYFREKFVYLPHCYQVNDHTQPISNKGLKKLDFGLPEGSFVFCSFNRSYKIDPVTFDVWMKILREIPKGVLWLQTADRTAEKNLRRQAETRGVAPERLIFAQKLPKKDEHLERLRVADLTLDTRVYNGHTTTSDSLWAGVPVITLQGTHFASRVSSSILTALGLPELITPSLDDYEALAVRLAHDPEKLKALRQKLAENRLTEPLFDTPRFVRNLERAYMEMWKIFSAGEQPRQIDVVDN